MTYDFKEPEQVELKIGVSYVSIENARENLEREVGGLSFDEVYAQTKQQWKNKLKVVEVEGALKRKRRYSILLYIIRKFILIFSMTLMGNIRKLPQEKLAKQKGLGILLFLFGIPTGIITS